VPFISESHRKDELLQIKSPYLAKVRTFANANPTESRFKRLLELEMPPPLFCKFEATAPASASFLLRNSEAAGLTLGQASRSDFQEIDASYRILIKNLAPFDRATVMDERSGFFAKG